MGLASELTELCSMRDLRMKFITCFISATILLAMTAVTYADNGNKTEKAKTNSQFQATDMLGLDTGTLQGAATLLRSKNRLQGRVMVNVATAGDPYTVWWVVFNNPEKCTYQPCTVGENPLTDLLNPAVGVSIFSAGGAISAANGASEGSLGVINLDVKTVGGRHPNGLFVLNWVDGTPFGNSMRRNNGFGAEVHLVVDRHPELNSWVEELTTTNWGPNSNHRAAVFVATQ